MRRAPGDPALRQTTDNRIGVETTTSDNTFAPPAELAAWLTDATDDRGPFRLRELSGGNANQTLLVSSGQGDRLLRRPPEALVDPSAHSLEREYRVLMALTDTHVPVPRPIALRHGRPALLMEFVDGVSLTAELPADYPPGSAAAVGEQTIDALAQLHSLPWRELGLADFGRPDGFLARQVSRWSRQYERNRHRELPQFQQVAEWLEDNRPDDAEPGLLHGDFHVDNCLFSRGAPAQLRAIIDWEMATIGDPLIDVGLTLAFWGEDRARPLALPHIQAFSREPGAPSRADLAARYEQRTGRSLGRLDYYMALAFWKLAAIVEGAHLLYTRGQLVSDYGRDLEFNVPRLLAEAAHFAGLPAAP